MGPVPVDRNRGPVGRQRKSVKSLEEGWPVIQGPKKLFTLSSRPVFFARIFLPVQADRRGRPSPRSNQSSDTEALREVDPDNQRSCSRPPPQCAEAISCRFRQVPPGVPGSDLPYFGAGSPCGLRSCAVWTLPRGHKCRKSRMLITVVYAAFLLEEGNAIPLFSRNTDETLLRTPNGR